MAWKARLRGSIGLTSDLRYVVSIDYYDDADPANAGVDADTPPSATLHQKQWTLPFGTTTSMLQALVVDEGQRARTANAQLAAARQAVPSGTIVPIP